MRIHRSAGPALIAWLAFALGAAVPAAAKGSSKPKVKVQAAKAPKATTTHAAASKGPKVKTAKAQAPKAKTQASAQKASAKGSKAKATKTAKVDPQGGSKSGKSKATRTASASTDPARGGSASDDPARQGGSTDPRDRGSVDPATDPRGGIDPSGDPGPDPAPDPAPDPVPQNKAQRLLAKNDNLRAKLQSRLPAGTDINAAAAGFRNLGQFVAAVNVSHNQGVSFEGLKTLMTTGDRLSLGQALQQVGDMDPTRAGRIVDPAFAQADAEIRATTPKTKTKTKTSKTTTTTNLDPAR